MVLDGKSRRFCVFGLLVSDQIAMEETQGGRDQSTAPDGALPAYGEWNPYFHKCWVMDILLGKPTVPGVTPSYEDTVPE